MDTADHGITKRCTACGIIKPADAFGPAPKYGRVYLQSRCKECMARIKREKRAADLTVRHPKYPFWDEPSRQMVKECRKCGEIKPVTGFQLVNKIGTYHSHCKECSAAVTRERYKANPEKYRQSVRRSAKRHPDRVKARFNRWNAANREYRNAFQLKNYHDHRDLRLARRRRRYLVDPRYMDYAHQRRARIRHAPAIEKVNRSEIIERDFSTCYLCNRLLKQNEIDLDHVIPLTRGGNHTADNLRVTYRSCNRRKGAKLLSELTWYNPQ